MAEPISGALVARRARGGAQLEAQPLGRREGAGGLKAGGRLRPRCVASRPALPRSLGQGCCVRGSAGTTAPGRRWFAGPEKGETPHPPLGPRCGRGEGGPGWVRAPRRDGEGLGAPRRQEGAGLLGAAGTLEAAVGTVAVPSASAGPPPDAGNPSPVE